MWLNSRPKTALTFIPSLTSLRRENSLSSALPSLCSDLERPLSHLESLSSVLLRPQCIRLASRARRVISLIPSHAAFQFITSLIIPRPHHSQPYALTRSTCSSSPQPHPSSPRPLASYSTPVSTWKRAAPRCSRRCRAHYIHRQRPIPTRLLYQLPQQQFNSLLRLVPHILITLPLHSDSQPALFRKRHVLLLHFLLAARGEFVGPGVEAVANPGGDADDDEED